MVLPAHVRCKPKLLEYVPWFRGPAFTIYPYIYLPQAVYANLSTELPLPAFVATLAHEQVHFDRQRALSIGRYALLYLFSREFRYTEELLAVKAQMLVLSTQGCDFDIADRATRLASIEYLWCVRYTQALADLNKLSKLFYENTQKTE